MCIRDSHKDEVDGIALSLPGFIDAEQGVVKGGGAPSVSYTHLDVYKRQGFDIVRDCMHNDTVRGFMNKMLHEEIIPTRPLDKKDLEEFASAV